MHIIKKKKTTIFPFCLFSIAVTIIRLYFEIIIIIIIVVSSIISQITTTRIVLYVPPVSLLLDEWRIFFIYFFLNRCRWFEPQVRLLDSPLFHNIQYNIRDIIHVSSYNNIMHIYAWFCFRVVCLLSFRNNYNHFISVPPHF